MIQRRRGSRPAHRSGESHQAQSAGGDRAPLAPLLQALRDLLAEHRDGIREYQVIQQLRTRAVAGYPDGPLSDPVVLFQSHFLLRHALYRLRDEYLAQGNAWLEMDALEIRLAPHRHGESGIVPHDPLRAYYDDLSHLDTTDRVEVETLLTQFWERLAANEQRQAALAVLELVDPVDHAAITRRYRSLAQRHHPDRGGDTLRFHAIRSAYETLRKSAPPASP